MHAVQRQAPTVDLKLLDGLPAQEGAQQAAQSEYVIEVTMRQKDPRQVPETHACLQDLALRPFPAIDQESILVVLYDLRRQAAPGRRRGGRSAKKQDLEQ